jgi:hypothetical protein
MDSGSISELIIVNRIEIKIFPDETKLPPDSTATIAKGMVGGAVLGAALGALGGVLITAIGDDDSPNANKTAAICAGAGAILGTVAARIYYAVVADKDDAFVFQDFLLTNRLVPIMPDPV